MSEPERVHATREILTKVAEYQKAKQARAQWETAEKDLKAEILEECGFDPDDEKPVPLQVVDPITGVIMFEIRVGNWRGMNFRYLKEQHPAIYAACETSKPTLSIKIP